MTFPSQIALCAALPLTGAAPDDGPEWVHLLPGGGIVKTGDGRGPYSVADYEAVAKASMHGVDRLVLDECHSTDLAAPKGQSAPARGWILALEARTDGLWGQVEWTRAGRELRSDKAYRGISPVIAHTRDNRILAIRRASLVNDPNLQGLTALHQKDDTMDWKKMLIELLKLDSDADDAAIEAAIRERVNGKPDEAAQEAVHSALSPIRKQLSLADDADSDAIVTALQAARNAGSDDEVITALQSQLAETVTQLNAMQERQSLQAAERFVDQAIAEGRVGVKPQRDIYIAMHRENADRAEKLIGSMPKVASAAIDPRRSAEKRTAELDASDNQAIALMGLDPEEYKKTRAAELGEQVEAL